MQVYSFQSCEELVESIRTLKKLYIAVNSDKIVSSDNHLINLINNNIGYTDGIGAVWALQQKGLKSTVKISGSDLWLNVLTKLYESHSFYFIGGSQYVIEKVISKVKENFPGIKIAGWRNGFIHPDEKRLLLDQIKLSKPDIIFVAMGSPRQELFMEEIFKVHETSMLGLGGSFDVYAGIKKRAPAFFLRLNLEFLYRYLFNNIKWNRIISDFKFFLLLIFRKL